MDVATFKKLEKLNIQIDVWIDEEEYSKVYKALAVADDVEVVGRGQSRKSLREWVDSLFPEQSNCTHDNDDLWDRALNEANWAPAKRRTLLPIPIVRPADSKPVPLGGKRAKHVFQDWSRLFYAKLLRAHIQEKGTDGYSSRLDDVVAYLENHIPTTSETDIAAKLTIFYLLELSTASRSYESLGFAERARRIMRERKRVSQAEFCWYYDLWARYNIGVAYFHERRYRKAVLEFNYVIWQRDVVGEQDTEEISRKFEFFSTRLGDSLLYLPSVLYRADVQLKLQLAYHSLDTLERHSFERKGIGLSHHKAIRAHLIRAEAKEQMEHPDSWANLNAAYGDLAKLERLSGDLGVRTGFNPPELFITNNKRQGLKGRFLDHFVQEHINWMTMRCAEEVKSIGEQKVLACANLLKEVFSHQYLKAVEFNDYDRNGYCQQLVRFLSWLVKTANGDKKPRVFSKNAAESFLRIAEELYQENREILTVSEKGKNADNVDCLYCKWKGFDLRRLHLEQYQWFTEDMLDFYDEMAKVVSRLGRVKKSELDGDKRSLLIRLIETEREQQDVRIKDLNLRYKFDDGVKLPHGEEGRGLCRRELKKKTFDQAFAQLLRCVEKPDNEKLTSENYSRIVEQLTAEQYQDIMSDWEAHFLHHLDYASKHQGHQNGLYFLGLQRWNSSSPAQGRSVGGGYLLYKTDQQSKVEMGIAIDPGFDFVPNLFHMGFSLNDIDIVLISHAHIDHLRDFESIILLLYELKRRKNKDRRIHVILTLAAYKRLEHIFEHPAYRYLVEPYIIDMNREIRPDYFENLGRSQGVPEIEFCFERGKTTRAQRQRHRYRAMLPGTRESPQPGWVKIRPTRAYHDDHSDYSDSFGFVIELGLPDKKKPSMTVGYTGDTKWVYDKIDDVLDQGRKPRWVEDISTQYFDCVAVVVHLGSLIDHSKKSFDDYNQCSPVDAKLQNQCEELVREKNHPYMVGTLRLLSNLYSHNRKNGNSQLVLLSEFGEELRGGIRTDLVKRLKHAYKDRLDFLPVDVGMEVQLWHKLNKATGKIWSLKESRVWCVQCEKFVNLDAAEFERYGVDEALYCVCRTCHRATPLNVLQDRLRQIYEVGYELRTQDS